MSIQRKWITVIAGAWLTVALVAGLLSMKNLPLPVPDIKGNVIQSRTWNHYGYTVEIRTPSTTLQKSKTSVNGYFAFYHLPYSPLYQLIVRDTQNRIRYKTAIAFKSGTIPRTLPLIRLPISHADHSSSMALHLFSLMAGLLVLGFGFRVFHQCPNRQMAAIFLVMASAPASLNIIQCLQWIVAYGFDEIVGADFFPLAYIVFLMLGPAFLRFFSLFPKKQPWADRILPWIYFPSLSLIPVIASWMAFQNDEQFTYFWGCSFIQWMAIATALTVIFMILGIHVLIQSIRECDTLLVRQKLRFMLGGMTLGAGFFTLFFALPIIGYHWFTPFPGYYNLCASIAGLIIVSVFGIAIMYQKLIPVKQLISDSMAYFLATSIIVVLYGAAIVIGEYGLRNYFHHMGLLAVMTVVLAMIFAPLRNRLQLIVDRWFGKDPARFEQALKEANANTVMAQRQADRAGRLAALGTVAAGLAHELKNPLSALLSMTRLLKTHIDDPDFRREFLDIVPRQVERMNDLIKSLLDFSRPKPPCLSSVNLHAVAQEMLLLTSSRMKKQHIETDLRVPDTLTIQADETLIAQVVLNLVLNALDAMPEGGTLTIAGAQEPESVIFRIEDTGIGIDKDALERIFDPFYTTKHDGTGLGLATTWRILKEHNATVTVESELGKGTTFRLVF